MLPHPLPAVLAGLVAFFATAVAPERADALALLAGDAQRNTEDPWVSAACVGEPAACDFPYWHRILERTQAGSSCSYVHLGRGWVLGANHSPCNHTGDGAIEADELRFIASRDRVRFVPGTRRVLTRPNPAFIARVVPTAGEPALPHEAWVAPLLHDRPQIGDPLLLLGRGEERGEEFRSLSTGALLGYRISPPDGAPPVFRTRWGTNRVDSIDATLFYLDASCNGRGDPATSEEAIGVIGDSGGSAWFRDAAGQWVLGGIIETGPPDFQFCGSLATGLNDLSLDRATILESVDLLDADGALDDNCRVLANEHQVDADGDGYGNRCDPDINQDGIVGPIDAACFIGPDSCFGWSRMDVEPGRENCAICDLDEDDGVGPRDFQIYTDFFGQSIAGHTTLECARYPPVTGSCR